MKKSYICLFGIMLGMGISANDSDALFEASSRGDLPEVQRLVQGGVDVNVPESMGHLPLARAALNCHLPVVKYLVEQGADVNPDHGTDPIIVSGQCSLEQIKFLVDHGANISAMTFDNSFPSTTVMFALIDTCNRNDTKQTCAEDIDKLEYIFNQTPEETFVLMGELYKNLYYKDLEDLWFGSTEALLLAFGGFHPTNEPIDESLMDYTFFGEIDALKVLLNNNTALSEAHLTLLLLLAHYGGHKQILFYLLEEMRRRYT